MPYPDAPLQSKRLKPMECRDGLFKLRRLPALRRVGLEGLGLPREEISIALGPGWSPERRGSLQCWVGPSV